jgi:S1-C subfamily serine protease
VTWLDLLLVLVVVGFAIAGFRQGFIVSVVSFAGFVVGGLLGLWLMPHLLDSRQPSSGRSLLALGGVVVLAIGCQTLAAFLGVMLRNRITWRPARRVDAVGGAVVGTIAVLVAVWLLGGVVDRGDLPLADQVRDSKVITALDDVMPGSPDQVFSAFSDLLDTTGFPQVFNDLHSERPAPVPPPDSAVAADPQVRAAAESTVKVVGDAFSCERRIEGSGFVYAPDRVMTNAHVVAGVSRPSVYVGGGGHAYRAHVVYFDPDHDIAVLWVPDLPLPALSFGPSVPQGTAGAAIGYPGDGPLTISPARVRGTVSAIGQDIYGGGRVVRQVYSLRVEVHPGNSGGPFVGTDGQVLGVVFAASREDPDTGYALTAEQVAGAAQAARNAQDDVATGHCA